MCYLENPVAENASEYVLDPLTFELERAKIQIELQFVNRNLNNTLIQVPSDPFQFKSKNHHLNMHKIHLTFATPLQHTLKYSQTSTKNN